MRVLSEKDYQEFADIICNYQHKGELFQKMAQGMSLVMGRMKNLNDIKYESNGRQASNL